MHLRLCVSMNSLLISIIVIILSSNLINSSPSSLKSLLAFIESGYIQNNNLLLPNNDHTKTIQLNEEDNDDSVKDNNEISLYEYLESDLNKIKYNLRYYFSSVRNSFTNIENKEISRKFIIDSLRNYHYDTWTHNFTANELKFLKLRPIQGVNIFGIKNGWSKENGSENIILIGAHYDTTNLSSGTNDNGSGMVVLLELARLLNVNQCTFKNTIIFAAFDFEEYGGLGSRYFVHEYLIPKRLASKQAKFLGSFILDSISNYDQNPNVQSIPDDILEVSPEFSNKVNEDKNKGNFLALISRDPFDNELVKELSEVWKKIAPDKYKLLNINSKLLTDSMPSETVLSKHINFLRSDHAMFWYHNSRNYNSSFKAILLTDTGPNRGYMKECYHKLCDNMTFIDDEKLRFLKTITDTLAFTIIKMAEGPCSKSQMYSKDKLLKTKDGMNNFSQTFRILSKLNGSFILIANFHWIFLMIINVKL